MIIYNILRHGVRSITGIHSSYHNLKDAERAIKQIASIYTNATYDADKLIVKDDKHVLFSINESCLHDSSDGPVIPDGWDHPTKLGC